MGHKCIYGVYPNGDLVYDKNDCNQINPEDIFNFCPHCGVTITVCKHVWASHGHPDRFSMYQAICVKCHYIPATLIHDKNVIDESVNKE